MPSFNKSRILIMATHGFEQSELVKPLEQLKAKGAKVEVAAPRPARSRDGTTTIGERRSTST
jgi:protease I